MQTLSQAALFVVLHVVGVAFVLAVGVRRPALASALGFVTGLALAVFASLAILALGGRYSLATVAAALTALTAASMALAWRRERLEGASLRVAAAWTLAFALVATAACSVNAAVFTYDSHSLILFGRVIGDGGVLDYAVLSRLSSWGVFVPIAHSWASFLPLEFLWALAPVLGLSFVPLFALILAELLASMGVEPRRRWLAAGLATAALATVYLFHHHFIYIHNNVPTAIYLVAFVGLMAYAESSGDESAVIVAFVLLTACAFMRVETPLVTLVFAVLFAFPSKLGRRRVAAGLTVYAALISGWYLLLAKYAPAKSQFLTPNRCYFVVLCMAAIVALYFASRRGPLARVADKTHWIAPAVIAIGLALAFAIKPHHMATSAQAWLTNLYSYYWGLAWPLLALTTLAALALPTERIHRVIAAAIFVQTAMILLFVYGRVPYRAGQVGDSANRMTLHVLPLLVFYLGAVLGTGLERDAKRALGMTSHSSAEDSRRTKT